MARAKRQPTAGDMVRSMAVLLIPLVAITLFFTIDVRDYPVQAVDWRPVYDSAKAEADFPVVAPQNLPESWTPTRVSWEPAGDGGARWLSGWLDPQETYFAVEQNAPGNQAFVSRVTREGAVDGTSQVNGEPWQRYRSADQRTFSLVRPGDGYTTVVVSDSSYEALESFAATLG